MSVTTRHQIEQTLGNDEKPDPFMRSVINDNALACQSIRNKNFDLNEAKQQSQQGIAMLRTKEGLQTMLTAQMLSVHKLQQHAMVYANSIDNMQSKQYYTYTAIKLANCFVQQANVLAKLQGIAGQTMLVGRVDVHEGGQAVVGNIQRTNQG